MNIEHPWQSGPTELIKYALEHLDGETEFDQRIAFLLLDIGVETTFKTFLQLPEEVTRTETSFSKRRSATEGNFHDLVRGVGDAAGTRLDDIDLTHIQYYHDLRNKLYHQGNGITIPSDKARKYSKLAVDTLKILLGVDLNSLLVSKQKEDELKLLSSEKKKQLEQARQDLRRKLNRMTRLLRMALEPFEPGMVLPSFENQLFNWMQRESKRYSDFIRSQTMNNADGPNIDGISYIDDKDLSAFYLAVSPSMPQVLKDFFKKYNPRPEIIFQIFGNDLDEILLIFADVILQLTTNPSDRIYWKADLIAAPKTYDEISILVRDSKDPIDELLGSTMEASRELEELCLVLSSKAEMVE